MNVLKGKVHPSNEFMKVVLDRRGIHLSDDQKRCMETVDNSDNSQLKIQAFAGTGKSLVLSLLVEAAIEDINPSDSAVAIVTPSRNLRDSILQSPDFLGNVFTGDDLGPHVVWLGRPSETRSSMCWEDKMADLVNQRLQPLRIEAKELEATTLRSAFEKILPWT